MSSPTVNFFVLVHVPVRELVLVHVPVRELVPVPVPVRELAPEQVYQPASTWIQSGFSHFLLLGEIIIYYLVSF